MTPEPPRVVLVIEDETNIVNLIQQSLLGMLVEVVAATDGEAGVALAEQLQPDLVLLDLALPKMDGWQVLEAIRATPYGSTVPVIVVTAHGDSATAVRARSAGASHFLAKPFLPNELRRLVQTYLATGVSGAA